MVESKMAVIFNMATKFRRESLHFIVMIKQCFQHKCIQFSCIWAHKYAFSQNIKMAESKLFSFCATALHAIASKQQGHTTIPRESQIFQYMFNCFFTV